jgi:hypothetical protein
MSEAATVDSAIDEFAFEVIHDALCDGMVIPFLGAGASMELRGPGERWSMDTNDRFGPLGAELAQWLGQRYKYPNAAGATDLARVAQFADSKFGRGSLRRQLERVFEPSPAPSALHRYLASFERPLVILTTNYDDMIETAFDEVDKPYHLIVQTIGPDRPSEMRIRRVGSAEVDDVVDPTNLEIDVTEHPVIFKIHGSCGPGDVTDYLITEDDYLLFLHRMIGKKAIPTALAEPMRTRQFLFIGYGLQDWNLRLLFHQLKEFMTKPRGVVSPSWAIMHEVDEVDRRLWNDRGVELLEIPLAGFVSGMVAARDHTQDVR